MSRVKSMKFIWIGSAGLAACTFAAVTYYATSLQTNRDIVNEPAPGVVSETKAEDASGFKSSESVTEKKTARVVTRKGEEFVLGRTVEVAQGQTRVVASLNPSFSENGFKGIRALDSSLEKGVVTIDMNSQVMEGMGSSGESEFLNLIVASLKQFPSVKSFQIRVDGKVIDSLGHADLSTPYPVRESQSGGDTSDGDNTPVNLREEETSSGGDKKEVTSNGTPSEAPLQLR